MKSVFCEQTIKTWTLEKVTVREKNLHKKRRHQTKSLNNFQRFSINHRKLTPTSFNGSCQAGSCQASFTSTSIGTTNILAGRFGRAGIKTFSQVALHPVCFAPKKKEEKKVFANFNYSTFISQDHSALVLFQISNSLISHFFFLVLNVEIICLRVENINSLLTDLFC